MSRRHLALVVHPEPGALIELADLVGGMSLDVETARNYSEAMFKVKQTRPAVILAGHVEGLLDAVAVLTASVPEVPDALRIALVGSPDEAVELDYQPAHAGTIVRVVGKVSEHSRLVAIIADGLKLISLVETQRELVDRINGEVHRLQRRETLLDVVVRERTKDLEEANQRLRLANRQALFGLAEAIEAKDPYTKGHCGRVAAFSLVLAKEAGYPDDGLEMLEYGAFLHDIGKIGVRDAVLLKPGPLDDTEWVHMREHPVKGYEIASKIEMLRPILSAVRNHHERWDGSGYPDRMVAEDIPIAARIVAIADAVDAMVTDRPYKAALPLSECEALLQKASGKMYDPDLVHVFVSRHLGALFQDDYELDRDGGS